MRRAICVDVCGVKLLLRLCDRLRTTDCSQQSSITFVLFFFASRTLTTGSSAMETMRKGEFQGWQEIAITFCL